MKISKKNTQNLLGVIRIVTGLLFLSHGVSKFLHPLTFNLFQVGGLFELTGGLMLILGWRTSYASLISLVPMFGAISLMHLTNLYSVLTQGSSLMVNLNFLTNGGETALMYSCLFLIFLSMGPGSYSLD